MREEERGRAEESDHGAERGTAYRYEFGMGDVGGVLTWIQRQTGATRLVSSPRAMSIVGGLTLDAARLTSGLIGILHTSKAQKSGKTLF